MRPPCAAFRSRHATTVRRFAIGKLRGNPQRSGGNDYVRHGPPCAVFRSENGAVSRRDPDATHVKYVTHVTTVRRFPIGKRRGIPQRSGGNAYAVCHTCDHRAQFSDQKAQYPAEIGGQRICNMSYMRPPCAVFRSENGAVSRRDPEATHVKNVTHVTTVHRFPIGKRRGIPQRSGGNACAICHTCDHRAQFSDQNTVRYPAAIGGQRM
jgi:hypothetical protein